MNLALASTQAREPLPGWTLGWGLTARCDLQCGFCYSGALRARLRGPEMELGEVERFLARNAGSIRAINFGTGESFRSPLLVMALDSFRRWLPNAEISITTNGALADISASEARHVGECVQECDVSMDFSEPRLHDAWRGRDGAWSRALRALDRACGLGLRCSIVMVGTRETLGPQNLGGLLEIARSRGAALRVNLLMPVPGYFELLPSIEQISRAVSILHAECASLRSSDRLFCAAPITPTRSCRVLPDGSVSPSTWLTEPPWVMQGALDTLVLDELGDKVPYRAFNEPPLPEPCFGCPRAADCRGGCVERRLLWAGSLLARDPLCDRGCPEEFAEGTRALLQSGASSWSGPRVHLEYLPTLVALPRGSFGLVS